MLVRLRGEKNSERGLRRRDNFVVGRLVRRRRPLAEVVKKFSGLNAPGALYPTATDRAAVSRAA